MKANIITRLIVLFSSIILMTSMMADELKVHTINQVLVLDIDEAITPATYDYLHSTLSRTTSEDTVLIKINTPGGLVSVTIDIIKLIANSQSLVIGWVGPDSASATSAGAIIASSIPLLYMAEGTRIGAATPITGSGDIENKDQKSKMINDLVALVKSQATKTNKSPEVYTQMVTEAKSYTATEALKLKVHHSIANSVKEVLMIANGQKVKFNGVNRMLETGITSVKEVPKTIGQKLLSFFASPNMAYILLLIGAALIYVEFQAPGGFIAGSVGAVAILLAGISFNVLPLNIGSLLLILLAFVLFVLEIYITSFGLLTIAGLCSLVFGSMFLFDTHDSYLQVSNSVIFSSVSAVVVFIATIGYIFYKSRKRIFSNPQDHFSDVEATIESEDDGHFYVRVNGELWQIDSKESMPILEVGDKVIIDYKEHFKLFIK